MPRIGPGLTGIVTLLGGGGLWLQGDPQQQLAEILTKEAGRVIDLLPPGCHHHCDHRTTANSSNE